MASTVQVKLIHRNTDSSTYGNTFSYFGMVMHFFNNSWLTVCDSNWIDKMSNSQVLCQQLGLEHTQQHWLDNRSETDLHFLHTNMNCSGSEDTLRLCPHDSVVSDTYKEDLSGTAKKIFHTHFAHYNYIMKLQ